MANDDPNQVGSVTVMVSFKDGKLYFSQMGMGFTTPGGGQMSGIILGTGDIDLSGTPHGDVALEVKLDDIAYGAGYRFPTDPWQAVALAIDPPGAPVAPQPVFDKALWPTAFAEPAVSGDQRTVTWTDLEVDQNVYEYSVAVNGPQGRVVLDPKISPGGSTTR
jgi:hypothetical protein